MNIFHYNTFHHNIYHVIEKRLRRYLGFDKKVIRNNAKSTF